MSFEDSDLEQWLRKNCMATKAFSEMVGCSRPVLYNIKNGKPVDTKIAERVKKLTGGQVTPKVSPRGRPKGYSQKLKRFNV